MGTRQTTSAPSQRSQGHEGPCGLNPRNIRKDVYAAPLLGNRATAHLGQLGPHLGHCPLDGAALHFRAAGWVGQVGSSQWTRGGANDSFGAASGGGLDIQVSLVLALVSGELTSPHQGGPYWKATRLGRRGFPRATRRSHRRMVLPSPPRTRGLSVARQPRRIVFSPRMPPSSLLVLDTDAWVTFAYALSHADHYVSRDRAS